MSKWHDRGRSEIWPGMGCWTKAHGCSGCPVYAMPCPVLFCLLNPPHPSKTNHAIGYRQTRAYQSVGTNETVAHAVMFLPCSHASTPLSHHAPPSPVLSRFSLTCAVTHPCCHAPELSCPDALALLLTRAHFPASTLDHTFMLPHFLVHFYHLTPAQSYATYAPTLSPTHYPLYHPK